MASLSLPTVQEFRRLVHKYYSGDFDEYDERDIERFDKKDSYTLMFIRHGQYGTVFNERRALQYFHEAMKWRKIHKVYDISFDSSNRCEIYYKNHDLDNHSILYMAFRTIIKDSENPHAIERLFIYHFEEHLRSYPGESIVMLVDMTDTGLKHVDYELAKFIICITQIYYPNLVLHILVYKLPMILTTTWNIIQSWLLPEYQQTIKFVDQKSITQFIQADQLTMIDISENDEKFAH